MRVTLAEIADITGGEALGSAEPGTLVVTSFSIDSREVEPGGLFVAVRGERDGHAFVSDALARGASAVLVEDAPADGVPAVRVADVQDALWRLARAARSRLGDAPVVAITGSTGKTSTKDLTAAALSSRYRVVASPNSFNNELGVPLTLLGTGEDTTAVVAEIGARGPGQIAALSPIVRHTIGIVTTVGHAHTERFGSIEDVAAAKGELVEALPREGTAILGDDHAFVDDLAARCPTAVLRVGSGPGADVRFSNVRVDAGLRPSFALETPWGRGDVHLEMRGAHQAANAAMGVAAAVVAGVTLDAAIAGVAVARGSKWRMEVAPGRQGIVVVNDAYNANPASMGAALEALASIDVRGRRVAVLGEMAELGATSDAAHRAAGRRAVELRIDLVVVVHSPDRRATTALAAGARDAGGDVVEVDDIEAALALLGAQLTPHDAVLVKASRVAGLERVATALVGDAA